MARPEITFEFNNKSENQFTDYQQLLFRYLIGSIALEHESSFKDGKVFIVTTYNKENKYLVMRFHGVNKSFLDSLVRKFPLKVSDVNFIEDGILVFDYKINVRNEVITTLNITK